MKATVNTNNPYASPAEVAAAQTGAEFDDIKAGVQKFRDQIHALGVLWVIVGVCSIAFGVTILGSGQWPDSVAKWVWLGSAMTLGLASTVFGVMACRKRLWAIRGGIAVTYIAILLQLVFANVCGVVLLVVPLIQAHRVLDWGKSMVAKGIPLDTRP